MVEAVSEGDRMAPQTLHSFFHFYFKFALLDASRVNDHSTVRRRGRHRYRSCSRPLALMTETVPYAHRHRAIVVVLRGKMDEAAVARGIDRR